MGPNGVGRGGTAGGEEGGEVEEHVGEEVYHTVVLGFLSRLHIAHCMRSHDKSIGRLESHVNSDCIIMCETPPF